MRAHQNQMELLSENILKYMQDVNHPQLNQVSTLKKHERRVGLATVVYLYFR